MSDNILPRLYEVDIASLKLGDVCLKSAMLPGKVEFSTIRGRITEINIATQLPDTLFIIKITWDDSGDTIYGPIWNGRAATIIGNYVYLGQPK